MPLKIMLDSNAFDQILDAPETLKFLNELSARDLIVIVTTHVQADELAAMPDDKRERREALRDVYARLTKTVVPTTAGIWDVSRWGEASWGSGVGTLRISDIMRSNTADAEDALISVTADTHADILVTNERTLPNRIKDRGLGLEVLPFETFMERMRKLA